MPVPPACIRFPTQVFRMPVTEAWARLCKNRGSRIDWEGKLIFLPKGQEKRKANYRKFWQIKLKSCKAYRNLCNTSSFNYVYILHIWVLNMGMMPNRFMLSGSLCVQSKIHLDVVDDDDESRRSCLLTGLKLGTLVWGLGKNLWCVDVIDSRLEKAGLQCHTQHVPGLQLQLVIGLTNPRKHAVDLIGL